MTFGEKIKQIRKNKGISQRELGIRLGVTQQTIAQYEKIIEPPKLATIRKIAEALEVPFDNIVPFDEGLKLWLQEKKEEKTQNSMEVPEQSPEDYRASFINIKNPSNPPRFTVPADDELPVNNDYSIHVNIDRNDLLNIALKKLDDGKPLTEKERQLIKEYVNSDTFRKNLAELPAHFKKLADSIRKSYSLLNAEGKKEAVKQIELADRQIELLTEIPKYRKSDDSE